MKRRRMTLAWSYRCEKLRRRRDALKRWTRSRWAKRWPHYGDGSVDAAESELRLVRFMLGIAP